MNSLRNYEIILKEPVKAQNFVWQPIEGLNLDPRFLT
jgi:hypothetical protein